MKQRGKRIRPSGKDLVFHFTIASLLPVFLLVVGLFHVKTIQQINWQDFNLSQADKIDIPYLIISFSVAILICLLVAFVFKRVRYDTVKQLYHRQKLAKMILENKWYESEQVKTEGFFKDSAGRTKEKITYFPKMYYRLKNGLIQIRVEITLGKYQDQLLHLEKKLESGLYCELTDKELKDSYVEYTLLYDTIASRISIDEVEAKDGKLRLMKNVWEQSDKSIDNRMESLKGYLTDELQALNVDTVRKDIPVSSSVRGFQIWTVEPTGDNEFNVTYSVDQLITEGENTKTVHSAYIVSVYVDGSGNMVLVKNPTITNIPKKSSYKPKAIESEGTVDSITTNEINEFLTTFFKLYPTATASELSYYVNDGILKPIGKEYIFQELVNPIHNRKDNQVTVSLTVEYIDQQTKATQVSQFDLVLEKNGSNWKIVK